LIDTTVANFFIEMQDRLRRVGALLLGLGFLFFGSRFVLQRSGPAARQLLMASIIYLPALLLLLTLSA